MCVKQKSLKFVKQNSLKLGRLGRVSVCYVHIFINMGLLSGADDKLCLLSLSIWQWS